MNVSIGDRWQGFVDRVVKEGRYGSASEVVREGLRLVEEREAKLLALRATLEASIAQGGEVTDAPAGGLRPDRAARGGVPGEPPHGSQPGEVREDPGLGAVCAAAAAAADGPVGLAGDAALSAISRV